MRKWSIGAICLAMTMALLPACNDNDRPLEEREPFEEMEEEWEDRDTDNDMQQQRLLRQQQENDRGRSPGETMVGKHEEDVKQLMEQAKGLEQNQGYFSEQFAVQKAGDDEFVFIKVEDEIADEDLQQRITNMFDTDEELRDSQLNVESRNGEITLTGEAPNQEVLSRAVVMALSTQGVNKVRTQVQVNEQPDQDQDQDQQPQQQRTNPRRRRR